MGDLVQLAPPEVRDALVRADAIMRETERLSAEAANLEGDLSPIAVARLAAIESAIQGLLAQMKEIDALVTPILRAEAEKKNPKPKRRRLFSFFGSLLALASIVGVVVSFATNPIVVLVTILALFFHTHAIAL